MATLKNHFAEILLNIGAIEVRPDNPFSYASGLVGPIYCDNRKLLSHPDERAQVRDGFKKLINENKISFDQLAGLATAGIPHAAIVADSLKLPMVYIRSKPKGHGKGNQVEGDYSPGQKLLLVEDLVNQGASLEGALIGVRSSSLVSVGCLAIVTYQSQAAQEVFERWQIKLYTLTDFDAICNVAAEKELISENQIKTLKNWRDNPKEWSQNFRQSHT